MSQKGCSQYNPLCLTLVFLFGSIIGAMTTHPEHSNIRAISVIVLSTLAFHLTHINPKGLLQKVFNKGS